MAQNGGVVIVNTSLMATGSNVVSAQWNGGWGTLVIAATQFAPVINLMLVGVGAPNHMIKMNSTAIQANAVIGMQLPAGTYQIHSATGSSVGLYAGLFPNP